MKKIMAGGIILLVFVSVVLVFNNVVSKKIEGKVVNSNNKPLRGVKVQVAKSGFLAETDSSGQYSIDYAPGAFTLIFRKDGFCQKTISLNINQKVKFRVETVVLHKCNETPKDFANYIIQTFKKGDKISFQNFAIPKKNEFIFFLQKDLSEGEKKLINYDKFYNKMKNVILDSWDKIYNRGKFEGIVWNSVHIEDYEVKFSKNKGIKGGDIFILISSNNKKYTLKIDDAFFINGKLKLFDALKFY